MRTDCPIHVRRLAAGSHNRQQDDASPPQLAEMATFIRFQYESMGLPPGGRITDDQLHLTLKESGCTLKLQTVNNKKRGAKRAKTEDSAVVHDDDEHVCSLVPPILCDALAAQLLRHPRTHLPLTHYIDYLLQKLTFVRKWRCLFRVVSETLPECAWIEKLFKWQDRGRPWELATIQRLEGLGGEDLTHVTDRLVDEDLSAETFVAEAEKRKVFRSCHIHVMHPQNTNVHQSKKIEATVFLMQKAIKGKNKTVLTENVNLGQWSWAKMTTRK